MYPLCEDQGIAVLPWSPLARGRLTRPWDTRTERTETDELSGSCQFCGAPLVADPTAGGQIAPEAVLPFEVDRAGVRTALRGWISSRWFAPSRLKKVTGAESVRGTYLPHWTFDARTVSDYRGQRGEHYWVTETYTVTVDGAETLGPFPASNPADPQTSEVAVTGQEFTFDVETSTGGNTGAVEIRILGG